MALIGRARGKIYEVNESAPVFFAVAPDDDVYGTMVCLELRRESWRP